MGHGSRKDKERGRGYLIRSGSAYDVRNHKDCIVLDKGIMPTPGRRIKSPASAVVSILPTAQIFLSTAPHFQTTETSKVSNFQIELPHRKPQTCRLSRPFYPTSTMSFNTRFSAMSIVPGRKRQRSVTFSPNDKVRLIEARSLESKAASAG